MEELKMTTQEFIDAIKGMTVLELNDLVKACEEEFGVSAAADEKTEFESLAEYLEGPTAIAVSKEDATAPARILKKFGDTAEALEIKAGVIEGTFYDQEGLKVIASIPSREELISKLLGSLQSSVANFARVIKQIAEKQDEVA